MICYMVHCGIGSLENKCTLASISVSALKIEANLKNCMKWS